MEQSNIPFYPINDYILTEKVKYHTLSSILEVAGENKFYVHKDLKVVALPKNGMLKVNGKYVEPLVKVGEIVLVEKPAGLSRIIDNKEYVLIHESDIIGIYDDYEQTQFSISKPKSQIEYTQAEY